ncbi:MAG: hypothetical protein HRT80_14935 [Henriciella sp.]|nr:hypothetical protein [Henriciella sp.]
MRDIKHDELDLVGGGRKASLFFEFQSRSPRGEILPEVQDLQIQTGNSAITRGGVPNLFGLRRSIRTDWSISHLSDLF